MSPRLLAQLFKASPKAEPIAAPLSERELAVLRQAAQGLHTKDIARRLQISHRTVEYHLSHILHKLQLTSRLEAVLWLQAQNFSTEQS